MQILFFVKKMSLQNFEPTGLIFWKTHLWFDVDGLVLWFLKILSFWSIKGSLLQLIKLRNFPAINYFNNYYAYFCTEW